MSILKLTRPSDWSLFHYVTCFTLSILIDCNGVEVIRDELETGDEDPRSVGKRLLVRHLVLVVKG